jgi:putative tricarboxylic transport membrane protein
MSKERVGSLIFLAFGVYGLFFSSQLPMGRWNEPGAGVFPLALSILLSVSGIAWFLRGKGEGRSKGRPGPGGFVRKYFTPIRIVGLTTAFVLTLEPLGFLLTSTLYLFVLFFWVSRYRLSVSAVFAIVFGTGCWLFFGKLLATPLPQGLLNF